MHTAQCFAGYMGVWALRPEWMRAALSLVRAGAGRAWPMRAATTSPFDEPESRKPPYIVQDGVAILPLDGPLMKARSKFGGTSTVATRHLLRQALADDAVSAVMLRIESPGGHVSGTMELAEDVRAATGRKPVHAYIEDIGASAAYWVASQAERITSNAMADVGSIGVYAVLYDETAAAEMEGVKVVVVSSGPAKGAGVPGTPITEEIVAEVRASVDAVSEEFFGAVRKGRSLTPARLEAVTGGGIWPAKEAERLGLLDAVERWEDALSAASRAGRDRARKSAAMERAKKNR